MKRALQRTSKVILGAAWLIATLGTGFLFWKTLSGSTAIDTSIASLEKSRGEVSYKSASSILWKKTNTSQPFSVGDVISTSNLSAATIETKGGHQIQLDSNTMIRLDESVASKPTASGQYQLRLMKGTIVAKKSREAAPRSNSAETKLLISSKESVVTLGSQQNAAVGMKLGIDDKKPQIFLSVGNNTQAAVSSNGSLKKEATIPNKNLGTALEFQSALKAPDSKAPEPTFSLKVPQLALSADQLFSPAKKTSGLGTESQDKRPAVPKARPVPIVRKKPKVFVSQKISPAKETPDPIPEPVIELKYTYPEIDLARQTYLTTARSLKDDCGLSPYKFGIIMSREEPAAEDWTPFVRIRYIAQNGGEEAIDIPTRTANSVTQASVDLQKACAVASGSSVVNITLIPGYLKGNGSRHMKTSGARTVTILSLTNRKTAYQISYRPNTQVNPKQGWVSYAREKEGADTTTLHVTPEIPDTVLEQLIARSTVTRISGKGLTQNARGVFFIKNTSLIFGISGTIPPTLGLENLASEIGASFGYAGLLSDRLELAGPPLNRLAMIESVARRKGSITLIARRRSFEIGLSDFTKDSRELLHMVTSVSAAFKEKPKMIVYPQTLAH